jgi:hypothetical protein
LATYQDALAKLDGFRTELHTQRSSENVSSAFSTRGAFSAFSTPLNNVHATGVGIRVRNGNIVPGEFVIKVYVFDKVANVAVPAIMSNFNGIGVDVEALPVQLTRPKMEAIANPQATSTHRSRQRPIVGGISISPTNQGYAGTLGCFVKSALAPNSAITYALSNNHVLFDVDNLPFLTPIVQPGPEPGFTLDSDIFAKLDSKIIINFSAPNSFDAALAMVVDNSLIKLGKILGIDNYTPVLTNAFPSMKVIKSGRTTGVTRGTITAIKVNGVRVNYNPPGLPPQIATFNDCIEIIGENGQPFSNPGDSGSVILEAATGKPVALLFAGDGRTTTACDLPSLCRRLNILPA